jgi:hypothetical protein
MGAVRALSAISMTATTAKAPLLSKSGIEDSFLPNAL